MLTNIFSIAIILLFALYIVYLLITRQYNQLKALAYQLMLVAERSFASDSGLAKMEKVYQWFYALLPQWLRDILPEKTVREKLQEWYTQMKTLVKGV